MTASARHPAPGLQRRGISMTASACYLAAELSELKPVLNDGEHATRRLSQGWGGIDGGCSMPQ